MNKRGWLRILEATISVMIITGVLLVVYSKQTDRTNSPSDYFNSLQKQILADISLNSEYRLNALKVVNDSDENDDNFNKLNTFVNSRVPEAFEYLLRVCELKEPPCKMPTDIYILSMDKDIFVEDVIISSDLHGGGIYQPKKVRLFIWEKE